MVINWVLTTILMHSSEGFNTLVQRQYCVLNLSKRLPHKFLPYYLILVNCLLSNKVIRFRELVDIRRVSNVSKNQNNAFHPKQTDQREPMCIFISACEIIKDPRRFPDDNCVFPADIFLFLCPVLLLPLEPQEHLF